MSIKILLIEDDLEKRRVILSEALKAPQISESNFEFALDVKAAKKLLKEIRFDLVILDINLPKSPNHRPEIGAGLDVLHFLKANVKANSPVCLFGLTACDESEKLAEGEFISPLWKLIKFSYEDETWKCALIEGISYLIGIKKPPYFNDGRTYYSDLAIITALKEELHFILELDCQWKKIDVKHDSTAYFEGAFSSSEGSIRVIAACAPIMGMPSMAITASKLIHNFRPKIIAITGICAGIKAKCEIGDILIADPCFDWGSGKWVVESETKELKFRPAPYPWRLDARIKSKIETTATEDLLLQIHKEFKGIKPNFAPRVRIDAMASGGSVLQASSLVEDVKDQHKNLIGIEMESYAVFCAAEYAPEPRPICVSIKSVCDFGDESKNDEYHDYAAYTSARFLFEFAKVNLIEDLEN